MTRIRVIRVPAFHFNGRIRTFRQAVGPWSDWSMKAPVAVSFFIQFLDPTYPHPALSFLLLASILQLFSAIYLSTLIFGGTYLAAQFRARRRLAQGLTAGIGAVFIGFGIRLATASLS